MKQLTFATLLLVLAASGCARFSTKQTDSRYEQGQLATAVTTKATAWTFGTSKSALTNFKAKQSESSQSADVGSLEQSSSGTNVVAALQAISTIVQSVK